MKKIHSFGITMVGGLLGFGGLALGDKRLIDWGLTLIFGFSGLLFMAWGITGLNSEDETQEKTD